MKKACAILILAVLILTATSAEARPLTRAEAIAEGTYLALHIADWAQTLEIAERCGGVFFENGQWHKPLHEINPILGRCPSKGKVNTYFLLTGIGHVFATKYFDEWRPVWLGGTIGLEAYMVEQNASDYNLTTTGLPIGAAMGAMFVYTYEFE